MKIEFFKRIIFFSFSQFPPKTQLMEFVGPKNRYFKIQMFLFSKSQHCWISVLLRSKNRKLIDLPETGFEKIKNSTLIIITSTIKIQQSSIWTIAVSISPDNCLKPELFWRQNNFKNWRNLFLVGGGFNATQGGEDKQENKSEVSNIIHSFNTF